MAFTLKWTQRASRQLDEIQRYIQRDNPTAAQREVVRIIDRAEILMKHPEAGSVYRRSPEAVYRQIVAGNYRLFYVVKSDIERIDIVTVWHGARGEPELT